MKLEFETQKYIHQWHAPRSTKIQHSDQKYSTVSVNRALVELSCVIVNLFMTEHSKEKLAAVS
jgi:hypothetical protein